MSTTEAQGVITVGLDGSAASMAAALWAAREATRRRLSLRLLHAREPVSVGRSVDRDREEELRTHAAQRFVDEARREVRERYPSLVLADELLVDSPTTALLRAAADSHMLVLGTHGMARLPSFFLGGTSLGVVSRAEGPVVLVRAEEAPEPDEVRPAGEPEARGEQPGGEAPAAALHAGASPTRGRVVVGVGLHASYDRLLEFAFEAAAYSDTPVYAVHGSKLPPHAYMPHGPVVPHLAVEYKKDVEKEIREVLRPWSERYSDVPVRGGLRLESPAQAVVHEAAGSDLLVVGRRRRLRAPLGPRIGPVAQAAVHHAACPVAVIPHD